jgi:predicted dehydrogenase
MNRLLDRRAFTRLSAAALAATQLPLRAQTTKPVGYAAIGLGGISTIFMSACANSHSAKITALVTGHPKEKGEKFAAQYGIPKTSIYTYETFDRIRDNKDVDAVYIGLPNSMHAEYTQRAAAAGRHVFCEKPIAISSAEGRTMIDACRKANVKLMIGYRIQLEPIFNQVIQQIKAGGIGQIKSFQGGFFKQQEPNWRLDRKLAGGGPLLDMGIYPLNAIRHITGEEPTILTAAVSTTDHSGRFTQVEQNLEWTMKLPSGITASCSCSYGASAPGFLRIVGDSGNVEFQPAFNYDGLRVHGTVNGKPLDIVSKEKNPYQFTLEADHFADCVRNNKQPLPTGEEGLKDMLAIEAIYRAAGKPIA